jgi:predicted CXXCH cytochrome family protein
MYRLIVTLLALVIVCTAITAAQSIIGTKHDLSTGGGIADRSTNESQVCIFCHTPHQAGMTATPLWNHTLSATTNYGVYTSSTLNATPTNIGGGTGTSNLCMSCHDGTVAVNSIANPSAVGTPVMGSGDELNTSFQIAPGRTAYLGTSLANDHPINFNYTAALATADHGLFTPTSTNYVDIAQTIPLFGGTGSLQCASCHDAHSNAHVPFLRVSNNGSALCLKCHDK